MRQERKKQRRVYGMIFLFEEENRISHEGVIVVHQYQYNNVLAREVNAHCHLVFLLLQ
jgi:hypothetical protein